jgi:flagellin-like hook-associated protein FlgL
MEGTGKIDSLDMAAEVSESVRQSILDNPAEAMSAQANLLREESVELIQ